MNIRHVVILISAISGLFLTTGCCSSRFVFLNVGKYDSIARKAITESHPEVDPSKLERRRFEYEDNLVWQYPHSTRVLNFIYYATNDTVYYNLPSEVSRTVPTYNITLELDGSVRRMSTGTHSYNPPENQVEQGGPGYPPQGVGSPDP